MTDRERWTVYPLLFLALGLSIRDKLFPPRPSSIDAHQLTIVDHERRPNILLRGADKTAPAAIEVLNADGKPAWALFADNRTGLAIESTGTLRARDLRIVGPDGKERLVLGVTPDEQSAGRAEWYDGQRQLLLAAGGGDPQGGVLSSFRDGKRQLSLGSNDFGTLMVARDIKGNPYLVLTCDERGVGRALLFDPAGNGQLLVGQPVNIKLNEVHPPEPAAAEGEKKEGETKEGEPGPDQAPAEQSPSAPSDTDAPPAAADAESPPAETSPPAKSEQPAAAPATESPTPESDEKSPE